MGDKKEVFIPTHILKQFGCMNCVWKLYGQCPHGLTESHESLAEGFCDEVSTFYGDLASGGDSASAIKEKIFLYTQEIQSQADHREFIALNRRYRDEMAQGLLSPDEALKMRMAIEQYKLWWARLTESVVKGLSKIADREQRVNEVKESPRITVQQLNVLLQESDDHLRHIEHNK